MKLPSSIALLLLYMLAITTTHAQLRPQKNRDRNTPIIPTRQKPEPVSKQIGIASATQDLAIDISRTEWHLGKRRNVLHSPISIGSLLSLLMLGTDSTSHTELKRVLHYPFSLPSGIIYDNYRELISVSSGEHVRGVNISMASRLFLQKEAKFLDSFIEDALHFFNSKAENLDFVRDPSGSTDYINEWVKDTTFGKIPKIYNSPLSRDTTFVAANTIYFNGGWESPFAKALTSESIFFTGSKNITIPMMSNMITCKYLSVEEFGFDLIAIPYKGKNHAMYILTPRGDPDVDALHSIESVLSQDTLQKLIRRMQTVDMLVFIPRMKLAHSINLKDNLQLLGVNKIFNTQEADFSKLTLIPGIFVNSILHEAILEVTETGTIAAAATTSAMDKTFGPRFIFNRPSLVFIRDDSNDLTLFWARVVEPEPIN